MRQAHFFNKLSLPPCYNDLYDTRVFNVVSVFFKFTFPKKVCSHETGTFFEQTLNAALL
jgi:hypothetical protein